jgi:hypothetical protein
MKGHTKNNTRLEYALRLKRLFSDQFMENTMQSGITTSFYRPDIVYLQFYANAFDLMCVFICPLTPGLLNGHIRKRPLVETPIMHNPTTTLPDWNLEAATTLSLRREPACFAFLCGDADAPPQPIDAINLDLASIDYYAGRASLWATLEIRSSATNDQPLAVLGFDEAFLRPFSRALIETASNRTPYRMTIRSDVDQPKRQRVVEYVTGPGVPLIELMLTPQDATVTVSGRSEGGDEQSLFQLPRTDSFLRAFIKMTCQADQALRDTLAESEKIARRRAMGTAA